jgi:hypothetical protein
VGRPALPSSYVAVSHFPSLVESLRELSSRTLFHSDHFALDLTDWEQCCFSLSAIKMIKPLMGKCENHLQESAPLIYFLDSHVVPG